MSSRRLLINLPSKSIDCRIGSDILADISRFAKACVGVPKRAVLVSDEAASSSYGEEITRGLIDAGFNVDPIELPSDGNRATAGIAFGLLEDIARLGITPDDLVVGLGAFDLCSVVSFAAKLIQGGVSCMLVPTTFEGIVCTPTSMRALDVAASSEAVLLRPDPSLVVGEIGLINPANVDDFHMGLMEILVSMISAGKNRWSDFVERIPALFAMDEAELITAICDAQISRKDILRAANPGSKRALELGLATSRVLKKLLPSDTPDALLRAEGIRFESRLAVDAAKLPVDEVFAIDDALEDLGIEELPFDIEPEAFIEALYAEKQERGNRFMFALPKTLGTVRLYAIEKDVLERHATAYLASRAELLEEE